MTTLAPILQSFFTDKLARQRQASPRTVTAYRDALRLLVQFASRVTGTEPWQLDLDQLDADLISAFLDHLEADRGNSARTRNARLAAIRSLFRHAAWQAPEHAATIQRVLAISGKRTSTTVISFLTDEEAQALLDAPDPADLDRPTRQHAAPGRAAHRPARLRTHPADLRRRPPRPRSECPLPRQGTERTLHPLEPSTVAALRDWLAERGTSPDIPLFCTRQGRPLSPDAIQARLTKYHATRGRELPVAGREENLPAHPPALHRDGPAARRRRHRRPRALARTREHPIDPGLHPRRPRTQGTRPGPHLTARLTSHPLPAGRPAPDLPRKP